MRLYPALEIRWASAPADDRTDRMLAELDGLSVTAVEERPDGLRVFFTDSRARGAARDAIAAFADLTVSPIDIPDDDWAARSQAALDAITIGRLVVAPPWKAAAAASNGAHVIVIQPSMGFGTGHHASTRLCLRWLQNLPLAGTRVIDVGTGSGVLSIASVTLGAESSLGIDFDEDAIAAARENLELNGTGDRVQLRVSTLEAASGGGDRFDVVIANLTGALIAREAERLRALTKHGAVLVASGFQTHERDDVTAALRAAGFRAEAELEEDSWLGVLYRA